MGVTNYDTIDVTTGVTVNGTTVINSSGAVIADIQAAANSIGYTELVDFTGPGYILRGGAAGAPEEHDASTDGQILVGDGTDIVSVAVSGDVTLANTGAVTIATGAVEDSMLEGLASGEFFIGVDGTAANNTKVTMSGDGTLSNAGAFALTNIPAAAATDGNVGTGNMGGGVATTESGTPAHHRTVLSFILDLGTIAGAAAEATGALLYTLPAGACVINSAYMSVGLTNTDGAIDADTPDLGIGTTIGAGANATLDAVGGGAGENILTGQTVNNVTGTVEVKTVGDQVLVVEAAGDHTIYLNVADTWAGAESVGVIATGTVVLDWTFLN